MREDTRPVSCCICYEKLYYAGHRKSEDEVTITKNGQVNRYAHVRCLNNAYIMIQKNSMYEKIIESALSVITYLDPKHMIIEQIKTLKKVLS